MAPVSWSQTASLDLLVTLFFGTFVVVCAVMYLLTRNAPPDPYEDPYPQPRFWKRHEEAIREFGRHIAHLLWVMVLLIIGWAYFSCCHDFWCCVCKRLDISQLNIALIPALPIACFIFWRLILLYFSVLESEPDE